MPRRSIQQLVRRASLTHESRARGGVPESYATLVARAQRAEGQGRLREARTLYERALTRLGDAPDGADASRLFCWIGRTYRTADLELSADCFQAALSVAEACGDREAATHAASLLAGIRLQQGNIAEAHRLYEHSRAGAIETGDLRAAAMTAQNLGVIAGVRGDHQVALAHFHFSIAAYRDLDAVRETTVVWNNVGLLHVRREAWGEAAAAYDEAMRAAMLGGDRAGQMLVEVNRAEASRARGDAPAAQRAIDRALALADYVKDAPALGEAMKVCGMVERACGDLARAELHLRRAQMIGAARRDVVLLADATKELGDLLREQGRNREALRCLDRARCLYAQLFAQQALADVSRRTGQLKEEFLQRARDWGRTIECNDEYTQGHCERVADIACAIARADGMDAASLFWFRIGALLHDVGKLVIPREVLNKQGALTAEEWTLVRSHPVAGAELLAGVEFPRDIRPIVESHHERWDGAGYPHGLAGAAIPRDARIVCIADVYDALTSRRSYKAALTHHEAMAVMRADVGRQFDPELFACFERVAERHALAWARGAFGVAVTRGARTAPGEAHLELVAVDACRFRVVEDAERRSMDRRVG